MCGGARGAFPAGIQGLARQGITQDSTYYAVLGPDGPSEMGAHRGKGTQTAHAGQDTQAGPRALPLNDALRERATGRRSAEAGSGG